MNIFIIGMLIGLASGIIIFPICLWFYKLIKNTLERRKIKRLLKKGEFLVPIDPKDYNVEAWRNKKFANIDPQNNKEYLDNLNLKIFKKDKDRQIQQEKKEFMNKIKTYTIQARKLGYSDEKIREEFIKKNYSEELIKQVFREIE